MKLIRPVPNPIIWPRALPKFGQIGPPNFGVKPQINGQLWQPLIRDQEKGTALSDPGLSAPVFQRRPQWRSNCPLRAVRGPDYRGSEWRSLAWQLVEPEGRTGWVPLSWRSWSLWGSRGKMALELISMMGANGLCPLLRTVFLTPHNSVVSSTNSAISTRPLRSRMRGYRPNTTTAEKAYLQGFPCHLSSLTVAHHAASLPAGGRRYLHIQPDAVQTLRQDFRSTITYFFIKRKYPNWPLSELRTTSRLERFNRTVRRRTRSASAYHSDAGLKAMMVQETSQFNTLHP